MYKSFRSVVTVFLLLATVLAARSEGHAQFCASTPMIPPFLAEGSSPLVMLVMGRDHKLYYEAYNDASDLNGDGELDVGYKPLEIDYYGYFDSYKTYKYNSGTSRFEPYRETADKKCTEEEEWSGDFLNYLTMSRMDAMRKVLYGGMRSVDEVNATVLERSFIPQDGHSWGKEYLSIEHDGYDIREYSPLDLPSGRHLFACTSTSDSGPPLLRVLPDNAHRIWEWVSQESPVACASTENGCKCCEYSDTRYNTYPDNSDEFENMVLLYANDTHRQGEQNATQIDGSGNPFGDDSYYLTIFSGFLNISQNGTYSFAVNGDDAVDVLVDGQVVAGWYGGHGEESDITTILAKQDRQVDIDLTAGAHLLEFRHQEKDGSDSYQLWWSGPDSGDNWQVVPMTAFSDLTQAVYSVNTPASTITDYEVSVEVCDPLMPEDNCKLYPDGSYKPVGILQKFGESGKMLFGLLTGSYQKNKSGGVVRKNISSFADEVDLQSGQFTSVTGIVKTIDALRVAQYNFSSDAYDDCGLITSGPFSEGSCRDWGNPVGEMMYESLRYFSGASNPTSEYTYTDTALDNTLGLPAPSWTDPFDASPYCAKPYMVVISDINPSYDTDQLPGAFYGSSVSSSLGDMNVTTLANTIGAGEGISGQYFIGESGSVDDSSCVPKEVNGTLGEIRGLCPEEPTKEGGYYSAAVSYYGRTNDLSQIEGAQKADTMAVALASPLPSIDISVGDDTVTLVPFGKSVGENSISAARGDFQPTNTIVDFYVTELSPTHGRFRVNFEDVEQGNDHDMDAIAIFEYQVQDASGNSVSDAANGTRVEVTVTSEYAAGSIVQHMGYIISGTTNDGTYLVVRDWDTDSASDPDYFLDTPPGVGPNSGEFDRNWEDGEALPLVSTRTFSPGSGTAADTLKDPLWYAAKWGGFADTNGNNIPDQDSEWDVDGDGVPDSYFRVTNALDMEEQLGRAFSTILNRVSSGASASLISSSRSGAGALFQSVFWPSFNDNHEQEVTWIGDVHGILLSDDGRSFEDNNGNGKIDSEDNRVTLFYNETAGKVQACSGADMVNGTCPEGGTLKAFDQVAYLWSAAEWLNSLSDISLEQNRVYDSSDFGRYIFTWFDENKDGIINDSGEIRHFTASSINETWCSDDVVDWIRGIDQPGMRSRRIWVDTDKEGTEDKEVTWRLGDVINSSPAVVGPPSENYDLIWGDTSYTAFYKKYRTRRTMVYFGANDGMLHAVNSGFFSTSDKKFYTSYAPESGEYSDTSGHDLGAELWAYVPYNLLRSLACLTSEGYNHQYYVDLKPRIFDVRIFNDDTDHPNGWGTILVGGMRFGGCPTTSDGNCIDTVSGREFGSSYFILDITNPEDPPVLLGEITFDSTEGAAANDKKNDILEIGYTVSVPSVVPFYDQNDGSTKWYIVFGTGSDDKDGDIGSTDELMRIVPVPLDLLVGSDNKASSTFSFRIPNETPSATQCGVLTDSNSAKGAIGTDFVAVDYNFDFLSDILYFGTVEAGPVDWKGGMYRLSIEVKNNDGTYDATTSKDSANWKIMKMLTADRPITGAPNVGWKKDQVWVYFGSGKFWSIEDRLDNSMQYFWGVKEPKKTTTNAYNFNNLSFNPTNPGNSWFLASDVEVLPGGTLQCIGGGDSCLPEVGGEDITSLNGLERYIAGTSSMNGWFRELNMSGERVLGKPTLLGGLVNHTTYVPNPDPCEGEGYSYLYSLYYATGTAWKENVFGDDEDMDVPVAYRRALGRGLTISPTLHLGSEEGARVFVQTSTGEIVEVHQPNLPIQNVHSGSGGWHTHDID